MGFNNFFTTEITEPAETRPESLTGKIIGAAIEVHRALGPGLLESTYLGLFNLRIAIKEIKSRIPEIHASVL